MKTIFSTATFVCCGICAALLMNTCAASPRSMEAKDRVAPAPRTERTEEPMPVEKADGSSMPVEEFAEAAPPSAPAEGESPFRSMKRTAAPGSGVPAESGLKAGVADDNEQYNYFLNFLADNAARCAFRSVPVANRLIIGVVDSRGNPMPNVPTTVRDPSGATVDNAVTYADGRFLFTPPEKASGKWTVEAANAAGLGKLTFDPSGPRSIELRLKTERRIIVPVPLDIVFVMDTTGSMGEEIERLKATVDIIRDNLDLATPRPKLRFGLVLYRDRGDDYVVRSYPLTADLAAFRANLAKAKADGGGDEPEDLEAALAETVDKKMGWNKDGIRLAFVVTDAPAQTYEDAIGYDTSVEVARRIGLKIHTIGTGGLPLDGEYQLRQIAQRTRGRYIFLTYGERGESEGGSIGAVSHHTGANWSADRLESIIIRFAKEELSLMSGSAVATPSDDWFEARPIGGRTQDEILDELFGETIGRLMDYSSVAIPATTTAAVLPVTLGGTSGESDESLRRNAERFGERLTQAALESKRLRLVERKDLQSILTELELNLSAIGDEGNASRLGKLLDAEVLVIPTLLGLPQAGENAAPVDDQAAWELYVKLVKVSTAEVLSVSRARIAGGLGLR